MSAQENIIQHEVIPADKAKIWGIWRTAILLAVVTCIEYVFAFSMERGVPLFTIFILLTLVKAYYIVAEFMHLAHEKAALVYSIILPIVFLLWAILALLMEASAIKHAIENLWVVY